MTTDEIKDLNSKIQALKLQRVDAQTKLDNIYPMDLKDYVRRDDVVRDAKTQVATIDQKIALLEAERGQLQAVKKNQVRAKKEPQYKLVVQAFRKIEVANPNLEAQEILDKISDDMGKSLSAIKKSYYDGLRKENEAKVQKVTKKVT